MQKFNHLTIPGENVKRYSYCGKTVWQFLKNNKTKLNKLHYNPAITFLGIYPRDMKRYIHTLYSDFHRNYL